MTGSPHAPPAASPPVTTLSDQDRRDWLALARTRGLGPVNFHRLMARFSTPGEALSALPLLSRRAGKSPPLTPPDPADIDRELNQIEQLGARLITCVDRDFPERLLQISPPPPVITAHGPGDLSPPLCVAIVGSRAASAIGRRFANDLAEALGTAGVTIVSGLAIGIDGAAHQASLATGSIAVVAGGLDVIYPPEHTQLHAQLTARGAVISERALGLNPTNRDFPRRNRLISGLADAVVVVEASRRSGSLITARFAGEQGRDVLAVPGHPADPRAAGTNYLLKNGAGLVETPDDVLEALAWLRRSLPSPASPPVPPGTDPPPMAQTEHAAAPKPAVAPPHTLLFDDDPVFDDEPGEPTGKDRTGGQPSPPCPAPPYTTTSATACATSPPSPPARAHDKHDPHGGDRAAHATVCSGDEGADDHDSGAVLDQILELVSATPTHRDEIIRASGLEAQTVAAVLMELELLGKLSTLATGEVYRSSP